MKKKRRDERERARRAAFDERTRLIEERMQNLRARIEQQERRESQSNRA
jgi:hypothetical protein